MKKKILFITGSRAEYYIQKPIINEVKKSKSLKPLLVVTGSHLSKKFGYSYKEIIKDKFKIVSKIKNLIISDKRSSRVESLASQLPKLLKTVKKIKPDCIIAPYDREEAVTASLAGTYLNIPVAHLGAGDRTTFNIDGVIRHSVTKLASISFCFTKKNYERVIKLGEEKWRVHNVGHTVVERYLNFKKVKKQEVFKSIGLKAKKGEPIILFIQHPVSNWLKQSKKHIVASLDAINEMNLPTIIIRSNSDPGTVIFKKEFKKYKFKNKKIKYFDNLEENLFLNIVRNTSVLLGNSSMGVLEAPLLNLPVVNVGLRQKDRQNAGNITFVPHNSNAIIKAVKKSLFDKRFLNKIRNIKNPYKKSGASKKIVKILSKLLLKPNLLNKKITY
jgi:GDP/UDP-N,N'-diacetylbacillosamine 2-epimerase (hydrolysing)